MLTLERPLVILDLEATGTDPESARIIQIALVRFEPGEHSQQPEYQYADSFYNLVDPMEPIPEPVQKLTGITPEQIDGKPGFHMMADTAVETLIKDADLAGYNICTYDYPLLEAEYERLGKEVPGPDDRCVIDAYQLEKRLRPRTLEAVYERRTGKTLDDAHDAGADVEATWQILQQQADEVREEDGVTLVASVLPKALQNFQRGDYLDPDHKLKQTDRGVEVCFGKHQGKTLTELRDTDRDYLAWMYREIADLQPHIDEAFSE